MTQLIPVLIPIVIQMAKAAGLSKRIPKKASKIAYPIIALVLGALSGIGFAGESSMAMAAFEGAGITGLSAIGVHSAAKNLSQGFSGLFR